MPGVAAAKNRQWAASLSLGSKRRQAATLVGFGMALKLIRTVQTRCERMLKHQQETRLRSKQNIWYRIKTEMHLLATSCNALVSSSDAPVNS